MTARKNFNTSKVTRMSEVFPQAVIAGNFIFISGTTGFTPSTGKLSDSFEEQAVQSFMNIKTILDELVLFSLLFHNKSFVDISIIG